MEFTILYDYPSRRSTNIQTAFKKGFFRIKRRCAFGAPKYKFLTGESFSSQLPRFLIFVLSLTLIDLIFVSRVHASGEIAKRQSHVLNLGTASKSGIYWPVGKGICNLVNDYRDITDVRCNLFSTGGSVFNINAIMAGNIDMAIVRSDVALKAYLGEGNFKSQGAFSDLRFVLGLYDQPVTVVIKDYQDVEQLRDLNGLRFALNQIGSGQRRNVELLLNAASLGLEDVEIVELPTPSMPQAFCEGEIDVIVQTIAHPSQYYRELLENCDGSIMQLSNIDLNKVKKVDPRAQEIVLNESLYDSLSSNVKTYGYRALLVSTNLVPEKSIQAVIDSISIKFDKFFDIHPALAPYEVQQLGRKGLELPVHPGAKEFHSIIDEIGAD